MLFLSFYTKMFYESHVCLNIHDLVYNESVEMNVAASF